MTEFNQNEFSLNLSEDHISYLFIYIYNVCFALKINSGKIKYEIDLFTINQIKFLVG